MFWKNANKSSYTWSIANKLTFLYTLATMSILLLIALAAYWVVQQVVLTAEKQYIVDEVHLIQGLLKKNPGKLSLLTLEVNAVPAALKDAKFRYYIRLYDPLKKIVMQTPAFKSVLPDLPFRNVNLKNWQDQAWHWQSKEGQHYMSLSAPVQFDAAGKPNLYMQMIFDGTYPEQLINQYLNHALLFLIVATGIIWFLGRSITRNGLKRLLDMIKITERITTERLAERIDIKDWPIEIIPLGLAFNSMLDRIEKGLQRISECTTELAHDIRTPINNLVLATEITLAKERSVHEYQQILESNHEEYQKLVKIIDNVLFLARADNQQIIVNKMSVDMAKEIKSICEFYNIAAAEKNIDIEYSAEGYLLVDVTLLRRALYNMLNNAIQHTRKSGKISIEAKPIDKHFLLKISDTGVGIAPEHLPYITDRFYSTKPHVKYTSSGTGLGLPIIKSIVKLLGGSMAISSQLREGTTIELFFPLFHNKSSATSMIISDNTLS